jgi:hypothetical protein
MTIPTEPIGSIPRPLHLINAIEASGNYADPTLDPLYEEAIRDTIERFEATGSPVITDGEQRKYQNFKSATAYCRPRSTSRSSDWARRTIAAFCHSAMIPRRAAILLLRKSAPAYSERRWHPK